MICQSVLSSLSSHDGGEGVILISGLRGQGPVSKACSEITSPLLLIH